jgi:hypothetical protein
MSNQISLTWEEFEEQYKPIPNSITNVGYIFETYGEEDEFVRKQDPKNIWTYTDVGSGTAVYNGYHWVNRIGYYITELPYDEDTDYEVDLDMDTCEECEEVIEFACQEDDGELTCTNCCGHEGCE